MDPSVESVERTEGGRMKQIERENGQKVSSWYRLRSFPLSVSLLIFPFCLFFHFISPPLAPILRYISFCPPIKKKLSVEFIALKIKRKSRYKVCMQLCAYVITGLWFTLCALYNNIHAFICLCATGLQPYTEYSFLLVACTAIGCGASSPSSGRTLEGIPAGTYTHVHAHTHI